MLCFLRALHAGRSAVCDGCTNIQRRAASPSVDVYVSFEQTIETLRDKLQQSDFELCQVSFYPYGFPVNVLLPLHCNA